MHLFNGTKLTLIHLGINCIFNRFLFLVSPKRVLKLSICSGSLYSFSVSLLVCQETSGGNLNYLFDNLLLHLKTTNWATEKFELKPLDLDCKSNHVYPVNE